MSIIQSYWLFFCIFLVLVSSLHLGSLVRYKLKIKLNFGIISVNYFLGQVVLSFIAFIISLTTPYPLNLLLYIFGLSYISVYSIRRQKKDKILKINKQNSNSNVYYYILIVILTIFYLRSLIRPFAWDDVVYHLPVVRELSMGLVRLPLLSTSPLLDFYTPMSLFYGNLPYSSEVFASILYTISFNNIYSIQLLYFIIFIFFLLFFYEMLGTKFQINEYRIKLFAMIVLLTLVDVVLILSTGYIDLNVLIYQFIAIYFVYTALEKRDLPKYYLSIIFIGYSVGIKYTSLYLFPLFALLSIIFIFRKNINNFVKFLTTICVLIILSGGYWYVKNFYMYKNPIYPLFFSHVGIDDQTYKYILDSQINLGVNKNLDNFLNFIINTYKNQITVILSLPTLIILYFKRKEYNFKLLFCYLIFGMFLLIVNFFLGSQITRFNILTTFSLVLSLIIFLKYYPKVTDILIIIVILFIGFNPLQHSLWQALADDIIVNFSGNAAKLERKSVDCAQDILKFAVDNNFKQEQIVNLWDPYSAVYYEDKGLFLKLYGNTDYNNLHLPDDSYLYVNEKMKNNFLSNYVFHQSIKPLERDLWEKRIKGKVKLRSGNCVLYEII